MEEIQHIDLKDRTKQFALRIINLTKDLTNNVAEREIGRQLIRSGMSVGANTRSAFRGRSKKEFVAKLGIVIEEADECGYWIELLKDDSFNFGDDVLEELYQESNELTSIFVSIVKKSR